MFKFIQLEKTSTVNGCVVFILPTCSWSEDKILKSLGSFHEDGFSFVFRFWFFKILFEVFWLMLFWTARVSLESLLCVECVVSLLKLKLRGGNWILPAVSALPAWRKNKHDYWEQWTFLQTVGDRFPAPPPFFLIQTKKDPVEVFWGPGVSQPCHCVWMPCLGHKGCKSLTSTFGI